MFEIAEFRGSIEPRICNFRQKNLHRFTKCITLKSIFVNNLNFAIVRIPLLFMYSSQDIFRACETFQFPLPFKNNSGNKWIPKGFRRLNFFSGFDLLPSFLLPYGTVQKAAKALALVLVLLLALQMGMFSCSKTL